MPEGVHAVEKSVDLLLEMGDMVGHRLELVRVLDIAGTAIWRVEALKVEVSASVTGGLAVAFDLATLAFVAEQDGRQVSNLTGMYICLASLLWGT